MRSDAMIRSGTVVALVTVALLAPMATARAEGFYWSFRYEPSVPLGSVRSVAPSASPVGFGTDARYWFPGNFSLGLSASYDRLYDTLDRGTYPLEHGAITGTIYRSVDLFSVAPVVHFYFGSEGSVIPYAGIGAGASWATFRVVVSDIDVSRTKSGFFVSPEGGILVPVDRTERYLFQSLMAGLRYSFSSAGDRDVKYVSLVSLQLGALVY